MLLHGTLKGKTITIATPNDLFLAEAKIFWSGLESLEFNPPDHKDPRVIKGLPHVDLVTRWGFVQEGHRFRLQEGLLQDGLFVGKQDIVLAKFEKGWTVTVCADWTVCAAQDAQPLAVSVGFEFPWEAAQHAARSYVQNPGFSLSQKGFRCLLRIGEEYGLPWTKFPPWGVPFDVTDQSKISVSWLKTCSALLGSPCQLQTSSDEDVVLRHKNIAWTIPLDGSEVGISLYRPSAANRFDSEFAEAIQRCQDLPWVHSLLVAARPPRPEYKEEMELRLRVVLDEFEVSEDSDLDLQSLPVGELRRALLAPYPASLVLAGRFGRWLEETFPSYNPDLDFWVHGNRLLWREHMLLGARGLYNLDNLPKVAISKDAIRVWAQAIQFAPEFEPDWTRIVDGIHQAMRR